MAELDGFLAEVLATRGGKGVLDCYQCGTCSGSCPVLPEMKYGPRRIMHMIRMGQGEELLSCSDMWYCVSCYLCTSRCPCGIEIADVMSTLRSMAIQKGYTQDKEAKFARAFSDTVRQHGRSFEVELMIRYYLRSLDLLSLLKMAPLAIQMLRRGKLSFLPYNLENTRVWRRVFASAEGKEKEA